MITYSSWENSEVKRENGQVMRHARYSANAVASKNPPKRKASKGRNHNLRGTFPAEAFGPKQLGKKFLQLPEPTVPLTVADVNGSNIAYRHKSVKTRKPLHRSLGR